MPRQAAMTRAVPAANGPRRNGAPVLPTNVPVSSPRRPIPKQRKLLGWELVLLPSFGNPDVAEIDPQNQRITMAPLTYSWLKNDTAAIQSLADSKAEAVRQMRVTMWEGAAYAPKADPARKPAVQSPGIKALCHDLQTLVSDMTRLDPNDPTSVSHIAGRYGRMRDTMAELRAAFTEAEGSFEVAQELLIQKMGIE